MDADSLPLSLEKRVDEACDHFEAAWHAGLKPRIEDYLAKAPGTDRLELLRLLLLLEIELRRQVSENPISDEYEQRFPDHAELIKAVFAPGCVDYDNGDAGEPSKVGPIPSDDSPEEDESTEPPAKAPPVLPGRIGRYKICGKLGGGTFGKVYLAHDDLMDRQVAIKVPSPRLLASQTARGQFLSEARSVARLQHEGIVRAYEFGQEADGTCYIVYEFIEGTDLKERIKPEHIASNPLMPDEAARIVAQLAEALHYAHLQGLVHRDIKPANILLDRQGNPRVTDFGLAVREEDLPNERGRLAGTLPYMSPEQVRREAHHIDGRTDIYSLGVVLCELICGRQPFQANTRNELEDQILHREAKPPRQIKDSIPAELERICLKALAKRIIDRYTTARDLAEELRQGLQSATARPVMIQPKRIGFELEGIRLTGITFERISAEPQALVNFQLGTYVVKEFVGRGGTGMVYRALNTRTGRDICLKLLYAIPDLFQSEVLSKAISRWVRGLTALNHANLVKPVDYAPFHLKDCSSFYIATEFIQGTSLLTWNGNLKEGPAAVVARMQVALDITRALQAAHNCTYIDEAGFECRGVLHGDIKPGNIIIRPDNLPVVVDFMMVDVQRAVSRPLISQDFDTTSFGTPGFMPPEQARDGIVTVKTDIFALGKTLAFLFFPGQRLEPVLTDCEDYRGGLIALLLAMVNDDPNLRPADMSTVAHRLSALSLNQNAQFSVYRPKTIRPHDWYTMLAFAHLSERPANASENELGPVQEVGRQAFQVLGAKVEAYGKITQESKQPVPRTGELTFVPDVPGIDFNPPSRNFVWEETVHREEFRLRASPELEGQTANGQMTVFLGSIILAEIPLSICVDSSYKREPGAETHEVERARPYRKIFASYSRKDSWVVGEFKRYAQALGDEYVRKHSSLRAGEEWSDRLKQLIEKADIFQLFWSSNSMYSSFVRREWEFALSLRRPNFIRPCFWENPLPTCAEKSLPPEELRRVHFHRLPLELARSGASRERGLNRSATERAERLYGTPPQGIPCLSPENIEKVVPTESEEGARSNVDLDRSGGDLEKTLSPAQPPDVAFGDSIEVTRPAALGQYVIDRTIAQGGLGTVYLGHRTNDPLHLVAIKVLLASAHAQELLLREFRRIAHLRHSGIVKAADCGVEGGWVYLVTDFVEGTSLQTWLHTHRPTFEEAGRIVAAIAEALHCAHTNGVVHRDVKPANIVLTKNGQPVLVDFGLATSTSEEDIPEPGAVVGTPAYMAPEQTLGQRVDGRADIYSLGVVLYVMLCGRHPFADNYVWERLRRVREEEPPPPRQVVAEIPPELETICLKAMAKRVNDRYATGADLAADIRRFLAGSPVTAASVSRRKPSSDQWQMWRPKAAQSANLRSRPRLRWKPLMLGALVIGAVIAALLWLFLLF